MKRILYAALIVIFSLSVHPSKATVWEVVSSGFTFSPSVITITLGDTVVFNLASIHNVIEVSQATWNANGNTSNGGFQLPFGGGMVIPSVVKTYYYVCGPHASNGMKGQIIVNSSTGIPPVESADKILRFSPNPASNQTVLHTGLKDGIVAQLSFFDVMGKEIFSIQNVMNNQVINLGSLRNGIYFVEINSEGYKRTTKLVIAR